MSLTAKSTKNSKHIVVKTMFDLYQKYIKKEKIEADTRYQIGAKLILFKKMKTSSKFFFFDKYPK